MERTPLVGFAIVFFSVFIGIIITTGGKFQDFISFPSLFITVVGSFGSAMAMNRKSNIVGIFQVAKKILVNDQMETDKILPRLLSLSEKARREGLLSLEDDLDEIEDDFLKFALQLIIDGTDPEVVKKILVEKINSIEERHSDKRQIFENLADLSPAFGMIGTVIGLIYMLSSLGGNLSVLGSGMATALITTFYGVLLANGLWQPLANKLAAKTQQELLQKNIILEGIISIQFGDNPRILKQKLLAFFSSKSNFLKETNERDRNFRNQ